MALSYAALFWITGGAGIAAGVAGLYWALFHDRARGRKRCPRCWYDMGGSPTLTCPECGHEAPSERPMLKTRRRWGWGAAAALLMIAGVVGAAWPRASVRGWLSFVPAPVLYVMATSEWLPRSEAVKSRLLYESFGGDETTALGRYLLVSMSIHTLRSGASVDASDVATSVLCFIGARDSRVTPVLLELLDDPRPELRLDAIRAIAVYRADAERAVPALIGLLERSPQEPVEVRCAAMNVLSGYRMRAAAAAPLFIAALEEPDPKVATTAAALMHLVGVESSQHLPRLLSLLDDPGAAEFQGYAAAGIARCGPDAAAAVPALIRMLETNHPTADYAAVALAGIGPAAVDALPALSQWSQTSGWNLLGSTVESVILAEHPTYLAALAAAAADPDPAIREEAIRDLRLVLWHEPDREQILHVLLEALDDPDADVIFNAALGFTRMGRDGELALPRLRELERHGYVSAGLAIDAIERSETPSTTR